MAARNVGIAPLIAAIVLAGNAASQAIQHGLSAWTATALVGGVAAVLVGVLTLSGRGGFGNDSDESDRKTTVAIVGLAALSFVVGVAIALA